MRSIFKIKSKFLGGSISVIPFILLIYIWFLQGQTYSGAPLVDYPLLRYMSYVVIASIIPLYLVHLLVSERSRIILGKGVFQFCIILILYMIMVGLYNNNSTLDLIEGLFVYLKYVFLYIILLLFSNKYNTKRFLMFFVFVSVAICVEAIVNYVILGLHHDDTYITLGPSGGHVVAGVFLLYACCIVVANACITKLSKQHVMFFLLVIVASIIASNRGTIIILIPLLIMIYLIKIKILQPRLMFAVSLSINIIILIASVQFYITSSNLNVAHEISPIYRLNYIGAVVDILKTNDSLLFGDGVRSMKPGINGSGGVMFSLLEKEYRSLLSAGTNQYVKVLSELGLIGAILYWLMLAKVLANNIKVWNYVRNNNHVTSFDKTITLSFFAIWLHFSSFGLFYNDFWRFDASALIFWIMALYINYIKSGFVVNLKS